MRSVLKVTYLVLALVIALPGVPGAYAACRLSDVLLYFSLQSDTQRNALLVTDFGRGMRRFRTDREFAAFVRSRMGARTTPLGPVRNTWDAWLRTIVGGRSTLHRETDTNFRDLSQEFDRLSAEERRRILIRYPGDRIELDEFLGGRLSDLEVDPLVHSEAHGLLEYEARVAMLSPGDTVVYGSRSFRLGRFLGAGNTTQVWELVDRPGAVIRIPFLIGDMRPSTGTSVLPWQTGSGRADRMREYLSDFTRADGRFPAGVRHARLLAADVRAGYLVMERIDVQASRMDWRSKNAPILSHIDFAAVRAGTITHADEAARVARITRESTETVSQLIEQALSFSTAETAAADAGFLDLHDRNWILNTQGEWVLLDFTLSNFLGIPLQGPPARQR